MNTFAAYLKDVHNITTDPTSMQQAQLIPLLAGFCQAGKHRLQARLSCSVGLLQLAWTLCKTPVTACLPGSLAGTALPACHTIPSMHSSQQAWMLCRHAIPSMQHTNSSMQHHPGIPCHFQHAMPSPACTPGTLPASIADHLFAVPTCCIICCRARKQNGEDYKMMPSPARLQSCASPGMRD